MTAILAGLASVFARVAPRLAARAGSALLRAPLRAGKNIVTRPTILQQAGSATSRAAVGLRHHHPVYLGRLATQARPPPPSSTVVVRPLLRHAGSGGFKASRLISRNMARSSHHRAVLSRAIARSAQLTRSSRLSAATASTSRRAAAATASRTRSTLSHRMRSAPSRFRKWVSKHKGMLGVTGVSIGVPLGVTAGMQAAAEAKSERFNNEYLKLMKSQNDALNLQQQQQQYMPQQHQFAHTSNFPAAPAHVFPPPPHPFVSGDAGYQQQQQQYPAMMYGQNYYQPQQPYFNPVQQQQYERHVPPFIYNPFDQMYGNMLPEEEEEEEEEEVLTGNKQSDTKARKGNNKKKKKKKTKRPLP